MRVAVAGAGIGGLTLAAALHQAGVAVRVFEHHSTLAANATTSAIRLWGPSLLALRTLPDVLERLFDHGRVIECAGHRSTALPDDSWLVHPPAFPTDLRASCVAEKRVDQLPFPWRSTACLVVQRSHLHQALASAVPSECISVDAHVERFTVSSDTGVRVHLLGGHSEQCDVLVGADGIDSVIRAQLFPRRRHAQSLGYTYSRGVVRNPDASRQPAWQMWGHRHCFGVVPMSDQRVFWSALTPSPASHNIASVSHVIQQFRDPASGFPALCADLIASTDDERVDIARVRRVPALRAWGRGPVTLLGDAAHASTPTVDVGACLAVQDALHLASVLRVHPTDTTKAADLLHRQLRRYERARRWRAGRVQIASSMLARLGLLSPRFASLRDRIAVSLPDAVKAPVFHTMQRGLLGWAYTPPPVLGLYHQVLGARAWSQLHPDLRAAHAARHGVTFGGGVDVQRGTSWLVARVLAPLLRLPRTQVEDARLVGNIVADPATGSERWHRVFIGEQGRDALTTTQHATHASTGILLHERLGMFVYSFRLVPSAQHDAGFTHELAGAGIAVSRWRHLPLPRWVLPRAHAATVPDNQGGWHFRVSVDLPAWLASVLMLQDARIIQYSGHVNRVSPIQV